MSIATNHLGSRGYVLDTKLATISTTRSPCSCQNSTRHLRWKSVAAVHFRHCTPRAVPKLCPPMLPLLTCLHRARMTWILEHPCDSWLWDVPKLQTLATQPRTAWRIFDCLVHSTGSVQCFSVWKRGQQRLHRITRTINDGLQQKKEGCHGHGRRTQTLLSGASKLDVCLWSRRTRSLDLCEAGVTQRTGRHW